MMECMDTRLAQDADYAIAEKKLSDALSRYGVKKHTSDGPAEMLHPQTVYFEGAPRQNMGFAERLSIDDGYRHGDRRDRMDIVVDFSPDALKQDNAPATGAHPRTDLRALQEGDLRKATLEALKQLLGGIALKDGTVADKIDFSGEEPESKKPYKDQVADLKAQVDKGIAEAGDKIPPEVVALLQHAKTFDTETGSIFGFSTGKPDVSEGHVATSFSISNKGEGEMSNVAVAHANLEARKEDILAAVREAAIAAHSAAPGATAEGMEAFKTDLAKLDMQVDMSNSAWGGDVTVRFGNKVETAPDAKEQASGERKVGKTVLAELSENTLANIINDSVLLKGKGAGDVVHLLAGDNDVERMILRYKDAAPSFAAALKSDIMVDSLPWEERRKQHEKIDEVAKIIPSVTVDTSDGGKEPNNKLRINLDLPEGISHSDVIKALAGKSIAKTPVVGDATKLVAEQREAAANKILGEERAAG